MRILIPSLAIAGLALAAAPAAAEAPSHSLYQEPFTATPSQPAATWIVHDGVLYAEPFSPVLAEPGPARPALATTSAPYTEPFTISFASAASPAKAPQACACACRHERG